MASEVRWEQRFSNFLKAFKKLKESVDFVNSRPLESNVLNEIVKEGLIQRFEYTHELAWNVMKDYAYFQGNSTITGSRDATREALQFQLISDGDIWMDMIRSRIKTSHTYNEETANDIFEKIVSQYYSAMDDFRRLMIEKLQ